MSKWNNLRKRSDLKLPKIGQRCLVTLHSDVITEAVFVTAKDLSSHSKDNWIFRDKKYDGNEVEMWCDFPNFASYRNDDDFPSRSMVSHVLSMIDVPLFKKK
jgi:hypothetical protein